MIQMVNEAAAELWKHYLSFSPLEYRMTLSPAAYLRLAREIRAMGPDIPVPDVAWIHTDFGLVSIAVSPLLDDNDAIIEVIHE